MADLKWSPIQSQVPNYADAGNLAINTVLNLGNAFRDTGKNFSDMMSENAARSALQYLASSYDPNDMQSINKAMPLALMGNPNMSSDMLKQLTGEYRTTVNKQLDFDNLSIAKERAKEAQNLVDMALANADVNGTRAANKALNALNVRADARTFGDVDPLLNSQAKRANLAADTALKKATQDDLLRKRRLSGLAVSLGQGLANTIAPNVDITSESGKRAVQSTLKNLASNIANIDGITPEDAYEASVEAVKIFTQMREAGVVPDSKFPLKGSMTASFINPTTLKEEPVSFDYDLTPSIQFPNIVEASNINAASNDAVAAENAVKIANDSILIPKDTLPKGKTPTQTSLSPIISGNKNFIADLAKKFNSSNGPSMYFREQMAAQLENTLIPAAALVNLTPANAMAHENSNFDKQQRINLLRNPNLTWKQVVEETDKLNNGGREVQKPKAVPPKQEIVKPVQQQNTLIRSTDSLKNLLENPSIYPTKSKDINTELNNVRISYANTEANARNMFAQQLKVPVDSVHVPKISDAFTYLIDSMYGLNPATFPANTLTIKDKNGKALSKEELAGLSEDQMVDLFLKDKDWSDSEKREARREYKDVMESLTSRINTGRDPATAYKAASLTALSLVDAANESNGFITGFAYDEDYQPGVIKKIGDKMATILSQGIDSPYIKLIQTQREQKYHLDNIEAAAKGVNGVEAEIVEAQKRAKKGKLVAGDIPYVTNLLEKREEYKEAGVAGIEAFILNLNQKK